MFIQYLHIHILLWEALQQLLVDLSGLLFCVAAPLQDMTLHYMDSFRCLVHHFSGPIIQPNMSGILGNHWLKTRIKNDSLGLNNLCVHIMRL